MYAPAARHRTYKQRENLLCYYSSKNVFFFITGIDIHSILVVKLSMGGLDCKANISTFAHFQVTISNLCCTCSCLHRKMPALRSRSLDDARPTPPSTPAPMNQQLPRLRFLLDNKQQHGKDQSGGGGEETSNAPSPVLFTSIQTTRRQPEQQQQYHYSGSVAEND
jgi:hypothetical protein